MSFRVKSAAAFLTAAIGAVYLNEKNTFTVDADKASKSDKKEAAISLQDAIERAKLLCQRVKEESGSPGLSVSVTINGVPVFSKGMY